MPLKVGISLEERVLGHGTCLKKDVGKGTEFVGMFTVNVIDARKLVAKHKGSSLACFLLITPRFKRNEWSEELSHANVLFVVRVGQQQKCNFFYDFTQNINIYLVFFYDPMDSDSTRDRIPDVVNNVVTQDKETRTRLLYVCNGQPGDREDCFERSLCILADVIDTFDSSTGHSVLSFMDFKKKTLTGSRI